VALGQLNHRCGDRRRMAPWARVMVGTFRASAYAERRIERCVQATRSPGSTLATPAADASVVVRCDRAHVKDRPCLAFVLTVDVRRQLRRVFPPESI
jgi:hypothetical protein